MVTTGLSHYSILVERHDQRAWYVLSCFEYRVRSLISFRDFNVIVTVSRGEGFEIILFTLMPFSTA